MKLTRGTGCCVAAIFSIVALAPGAAQADGIIKVGFDGAGQANFTVSGTSLSNTYNVNGGMSMAVEGLWALDDYVDAGLGFGLESYRQLTNYPSAGYMSFYPLYVKMQLHPKIDGITPYLNMEGGFAIFNADTALTNNGMLTPDGGGHLGIGGGVYFGPQFFAELMVTEDFGGLSYNGTRVLDISYTKATISAGVRF